MASRTSGLTHIKKNNENICHWWQQLDQYTSFTFRVRPFDHWFCYLFVIICIYSFYPVLHVAARFFRKIVKMWVSPLVHDAIQLTFINYPQGWCTIDNREQCNIYFEILAARSVGTCISYGYMGHCLKGNFQLLDSKIRMIMQMLHFRMTINSELEIVLKS